MSQRTVLAAVVGGVTLFLLGFVAYVVLFGDFFAANGTPVAAAPVYWAIFCGELAFSCLLTYIFSQWAGISTFAGGFKGGAIVGALSALSIGLIQFGAMGSMTLAAVGADAVINLVRAGLAGGVIGLVLGRK